MFNDAIDDQPQAAAAAGFQGMDCNTNPVLLEPGMVADGKNMYCRSDGAIETRPGIKVACTSVVALLNQYGPASFSLPITTVGYFDVPGYEAAIFYSSNYFWAITSGANNATPVRIVSSSGLYTIPADASPLVQMLDSFYYLDIFGRINWLTYTSGVWTSGILTTFSSGALMPVWGIIVTQGFRLIAIETDGYKLYASAIGSATSAANWVSTENIRVGNGEGDPAQAVLATQGNALTVLNGHSAYQIGMDSASVANWTSIQVCRHTGCIQRRTAVVLGQDVFFLSRFGVVSLGALSDTLSISAQDTISYPIQPYINRINWAQIANAFAVTWRDYYLLALPLDAESHPTRLFAYHLKLRRWMPPWVYNAPAFLYPGSTGLPAFHIRTPIVTEFGGKTETLIADSNGQLLRLDETAESDETTASIAAAAPYAPSFGYIAIDQYMRTRSFTHDQPAARKQPFFVEIECFDNTATFTIDTVLLVDGQATVTAAPDTNTVGRVAQWTPAGGSEKKRYLLRGQFYGRTLAPYREASVELYRSGSKMAVRAVVLSAFVDPPYFTD